VKVEQKQVWLQYGSVSQRLKSPHMKQSPPTRTNKYSKSRFQIEFIFRDAKQFTGLCDCQSRQQKSLDFHFNASFAALNIAKLEQQTQSDTGEDSQPQSFSMATYKRLLVAPSWSGNPTEAHR
jgi:hypothetical protein